MFKWISGKALYCISIEFLETYRYSTSHQRFIRSAQTLKHFQWNKSPISRITLPAFPSSLCYWTVFFPNRFRVAILLADRDQSCVFLVATGLNIDAFRRHECSFCLKFNELSRELNLGALLMTGVIRVQIYNNGRSCKIWKNRGGPFKGCFTTLLELYCIKSVWCMYYNYRMMQCWSFSTAVKLLLFFHKPHPSEFMTSSQSSRVASH